MNTGLLYMEEKVRKKNDLKRFKVFAFRNNKKEKRKKKITTLLLKTL